MGQPHASQSLGRRCRLDTLGDDDEIERFGQIENGPDDRLR